MAEMTAITREELFMAKAAGDNVVTPRPITRKEMFLERIAQNSGGGSGGGAQSDWNQTDESAADFIKNKPFGDMPTGGDTLYWDGNTEGLVSVADAFYKVSDAVPTAADCQGGVVISYYDGGAIYEVSITAEEIVQIDDALIITEIFIISAANAEVDNLVFPETGTYFICDEGAYFSSITIPGYTGFPVTKKMEEKYLPGAVILYTDAEKYLYATSDTSDTSKRMTKAELEKIVHSGSSVFLYEELDGAKLLMTCVMFDLLSRNYGMVQDGIGFSFHTAEYTE